MLRTPLTVSRVSILALVGFTLAGCDGATRPESLAGTYVLTRVNEEPPPHAVLVETVSTAAGPAHRLVSVDAGAIVLQAAGAASLRLTGSETVTSFLDGSVLASTTRGDTLEGILAGGSLDFFRDTLRLAGGPLVVVKSTVSRPGITMLAGRTGLGVELRFER